MRGLSRRVGVILPLVIVPSLVNTLVLPIAATPLEKFPVVVIIPLLMTVFPVAPLKSSMPTEFAPVVEIVPAFNSVFHWPPAENIPSDCDPDVVIVPLLVIVLLLSNRMASNVSPATVMAPALVTRLWSRIRMPLALMTLICDPVRMLTVTFVLPGTAATPIVSGLGEAVPVTVWPDAGV